jgi:methylglutaconyl-CoA hydratase
MSDQLRIERDDRGVVTLTLDRPEVRNAFGPEVMEAVRSTVCELRDDHTVRAVVLTGAGDVFSAGADLNWMSAMAEGGHDDQVADSQKLDDVFHAVDSFPAPVIARVNGHALAGAMGLVACADIAVAVRGAKLGFTEAKLGLAPAVISTYVQPKIGVSNARRYFLTGELFDADRAFHMGLVHEVCEPDELDATMARILDAVLAGGPQAQRAIKELIPNVAATTTPADARRLTVPTIARLRMSEEGQAGMRAFLDRQPVPWAPDAEG